jgi:hypothetical protein
VEARTVTASHPDLNTTLVHEPHGAPNSFLPAMPEVLMPMKDVEALIRKLKAPSEFSRTPSFCDTWQVCSVPPYLPNDRLTKEQRLQAAKNSYFIKRFVPVRLVAVNISSNDGLAALIRRAYDDMRKPPLDQHYSVFVGDVNIFERAIKVLTCVGYGFFVTGFCSFVGMFVVRSCMMGLREQRDYGTGCHMCLDCGTRAST